MAIQTITIKAGESAYLPKNATILAVDDPGNIGILSICIDTESLPTLQCYTLTYVVSENDNPTDAWEVGDPGNKVVKVSVGGIVETVDYTIDDYTSIANKLVSMSGGAITIVSSGITSAGADLSHKQVVEIKFNAPESLGSVAYLSFTVTGISGYQPGEFRLNAVSCPVT